MRSKTAGAVIHVSYTGIISFCIRLMLSSTVYSAWVAEEEKFGGTWGFCFREILCFRSVVLIFLIKISPKIVQELVGKVLEVYGTGADAWSVLSRELEFFRPQVFQHLFRITLSPLHLALPILPCSALDSRIQQIQP